MGTGSFFQKIGSQDPFLKYLAKASPVAAVAHHNVQQATPSNTYVPPPYFAGRTPTLADSNNEYVQAAINATPKAAPAAPAGKSIQPIKPRSLGAFF